MPFATLFILDNHTLIGWIFRTSIIYVLNNFRIMNNLCYRFSITCNSGMHVCTLSTQKKFWPTFEISNTHRPNPGPTPADGTAGPYFFISHSNPLIPFSTGSICIVSEFRHWVIIWIFGASICIVVVCSWSLNWHWLVATATTVERVFSGLNLVKNQMRNHMGDELLNDCLVTFIEREIFSNISEDDIIHTFMAMRKRKAKALD